MKNLSMIRWGGIVSALLTVSCFDPAKAILDKSGQPGVIFVKSPSQKNDNHDAMKQNLNEFVAGTDIFLLSPISSSGTLKNLTSPFTRGNEQDPSKWGAAQDPELSPDGTHMVFSMKTRNDRDAKWYIYELEVESGELTQLTTTGNDMDPAYLPDGRITFTSTRTEIVDEYERRPSPLLHIGSRSGTGEALSNIQQLSFNQSHDMNPWVHSSGKIYFSRWEHFGGINRIPLFTVNPDGSGLFILYGGHTPRENGSRTFLEAREMSDGGIVTSIMGRADDFEGGALAIIDLSDEDNLTYITEKPFDDENPMSMIFKTPHPIFDQGKEKIIASGAPSMNRSGEDAYVDYGLYIVDKDGSTPKLVYNDPSTNELDPIPYRTQQNRIVAQTYDDNQEIVDAVNNQDSLGFFFTADVYDRSSSDGQMQPDRDKEQAKFVRVLEAIPLPSDGNTRMDRSQVGGDIGETNLEKQRLIGYGNVMADGSFSMALPADLSIHLQVLDSNGMALVTQKTWTQVKPGEKRVCTGCHASHDRDSEIDFIKPAGTAGRMEHTQSGIKYMAGFDTPDTITHHPAVSQDTLEFFNRLEPLKVATVQNIFDQKCASCHGSQAAELGGGLRLTNTASDLEVSSDEDDELYRRVTSVYTRLLEYNSIEVEGDSLAWINDGSARHSPLMWVLFDQKLNEDLQTASPITSSYNHRELWKEESGKIDVFDPENIELLRIIEWIDMGAQYSNTVGY